MDPARRKKIIRLAYACKDPALRRRALDEVLADYSPGFLKKVEDQKFKHPDTGNEVKFISLPKDTQADIYKSIEGPSKHDPATKTKKAPEDDPSTKEQKGLKYKDRKEIIGRPKEPSEKIVLSAEERATLVPEWMADKDKEKADKMLGEATPVSTLKKLQGHVEKALKNPEGAYMAALKKSGYEPGDLVKMNATLRRVQEGRKYSGKILPIWNKYDLEGEDADELYEFKADKPGRGRRLTDQELMKKFLAQAAPETRERMQGMSLEDFMVAYKAIMDDEDEDEI